jgi:hypothetical protein
MLFSWEENPILRDGKGLQREIIKLAPDLTQLLRTLR